jgi:hypothetical protein
MLFFIMRGRVCAYIYLCCFVLPFVFFSGVLSHGFFEDFVCSKRPCQYLLNNYALNNTIICSKFFVRGVKFYTDKDVAVIDINGSGFFSPHPIAYLNSDEKVRNFLLRYSITYAILKKSAWDTIARIAGSNGLKTELLEVAGDEYIVRIQAG